MTNHLANQLWKSIIIIVLKALIIKKHKDEVSLAVSENQNSRHQIINHENQGRQLQNQMFRSMKKNLKTEF